MHSCADRDGGKGTCEVVVNVGRQRRRMAQRQCGEQHHHADKVNRGRGGVTSDTLRARWAGRRTVWRDERRCDGDEGKRGSQMTMSGMRYVHQCDKSNSNSSTERWTPTTVVDGGIVRMLRDIHGIERCVMGPSGRRRQRRKRRECHGAARANVHMEVGEEGTVKVRVAR